MSLINDALKKAQRQRTGDSPQSAPPMPGSGPAPSRPPGPRNGGNPPFLLIGAGTLLGLVIAGGAFFLLRSKSATDGASMVTPPRVTETSSTKAAATLAATPATDAPAVAPAKSPEPALVVKTEPAVTAPPVTPAPTSATETAGKTVPPPAVATPSSSEPPAPSLRMIEAIEALRVAGIRVGTGTDAKVLMNDRVYRIGDTVDHALGIKLTGATASSLTFRDASGAIYTRNF